MILRLHAFQSYSRSNGPGLRAVVWFQGCTLGCPGCFNPATHAAQAGYLADTEALAAQILALRPDIEGLSISGGEPFQQPEALLDLLQRLDGSGLGCLVFSGYTLEEILAQPLGRETLAHCDVLIAGRYVAREREAVGLLGSANQTLHFLTGRYTPEDLASVPPREVILHPDGSVTSSGIDPWHGVRRLGSREPTGSPLRARATITSTSRGRRA